MEIKEQILKDIIKLEGSIDYTYERLKKEYVPKKADLETFNKIFEELLDEKKIKIVDGIIKPYNYDPQAKKQYYAEVMITVGIILIVGGFLSPLTTEGGVMYFTVIFLVVIGIIFLGLGIRKKYKDKK